MAERHLVDLHLHSSASDGTDQPHELVERAADAGVATMALVDHDVLDGVPAAMEVAERLGIECIPGTELSVSHERFKLHLLVYFLEQASGPLQDRLGWLREGRNARNVEIVANLNRLGYQITIEDVLAEAAGRSVGRPHIADALVTTGQFASRDDAFNTLLGDGGEAYVERDRLSAVNAVQLARASGSVPVIAHPYTIKADRSEYATIFRDLTEAGLGGIEAHHSAHSPDLRHSLTLTAHKLGLAATGGSDYHGAGKREYRIGLGKGDLHVPASAVDELKAQRS